MTMSMDSWYFWAFAFAFGTTGPSWVLFGRLIMARIEKAIKADGKVYPSTQDWGVRIFWYAWVIVIPAGMLNSFDTRMISPYVKNSDYPLALLVVLSSGVSIVVLLLGACMEYL